MHEHVIACILQTIATFDILTPGVLLHMRQEALKLVSHKSQQAEVKWVSLLLQFAL